VLIPFFRLQSMHVATRLCLKSSASALCPTIKQDGLASESIGLAF
jgi:hypothetical protein